MSLELQGHGKDTQRLCPCELVRKTRCLPLPLQSDPVGLSVHLPLKIRCIEYNLPSKKYTHFGAAPVENRRGDFRGGAVVRILCFRCRGVRWFPGQRSEMIPHATLRGQTHRNTKKRMTV